MVIYVAGILNITILCLEMWNINKVYSQHPKLSKI